VHDFVVLGAGIIGMSTAMQLARAYPDAKILVLDKENGPARHQTGRNSGVIHAGVYYKPGSLKADFCLRGNRATKEFCDGHDIPYLECGKLLVATTDVELHRMQELWHRSAENGLTRIWISEDELREREPRIRGLGAIFVPSTAIVEFGRVTDAMAGVLGASGGEIQYGAEVLRLEEQKEAVIVGTTQGEYRCRYLITCSGLMADRVVQMLGRRPGFAICPFRGEYYLLRPEHNGIVKHLIYPIPDPAMPFLGVHLTRMIDGTVTVGPNAVLALKREGYRKQDVSFADTVGLLAHRGVRKALKRHARAGVIEMKNSLSKTAYLSRVRKYCPELALDDLMPYPAGVRAQAVSDDGSLVDDFLFHNTARTVNVCNAPSPAATSAIPIGAFIVEKVRGMVGN